MQRIPNATLVSGGRVQLESEEVWDAPTDLEVYATREAEEFLVWVRVGLVGQVEPRWIRPFWGVTIPRSTALREELELGPPR